MDPRLRAALDELGLASWCEALAPVIDARLSDSAHGNMPAWRAAVAALPDMPDPSPQLDLDCIRIGRDDLPDNVAQAVRSQLQALCPWRKGPFDVGGIVIDTEWRSDLKWQRIEAAVGSLAGQRVLDVGCGNGYYALRMLGAGARVVIGVDPTALFVMQFAALSRLLPPLPAFVLPLRAEELPGNPAAFDTVFSMGVLYHQRAPVDHLRGLRGHLAKNGRLVLETLVLPGDTAFSRTPPDRYARMRNVWHLPTLPELETWLSRSGFKDVRCADVTRTTTAEQRTTDWMSFESLAEALDPADPARTVEGWPAPLRAVVTATTGR